jgi:hypothetical protein
MKKRFLVLEERVTITKSGIKGKRFYKTELALIEVIKSEKFPTDTYKKYKQEGRKINIVEIPKKSTCDIILHKTETIR